MIGNLDKKAITKQLQKILDSPDFQASKSQSRILKYVVSETLEGRAEGIKGYSVDIHVLGKKADFDPKFDPIVSVHAGKLRSALERYYLVAGQSDPIQIDIPKGGYVPKFIQQAKVERSEAQYSRKRPDTVDKGSWPALVVHPFENLTGDPDMDHFGIGLSTELAIEMARFQDVKVIRYNPLLIKDERLAVPARFAIGGNVRRDAAEIKVAVHLTDTKTQMQIWGDMHKSEYDTARLIAFQEIVSRAVAAKITGESGILVKTLSIESKNLPPSDLEAYDAILRYYEFDSKYTPETFLRAFDALKTATAKEPELALAWSMLARLYANNHSLEIFDLNTPIEEALIFAGRGVKLNPGSQQARVILAYVLLLKNELTAGLAEIDRALELNPKSLIFLDYI